MPAEYRVYVATAADTAADPDAVSDFGYPESPTLAAEDPVGGVFDAGDIEKSANGRVLHHSFRIFQGLLMRRFFGKPYVLVHEGDGRFTERGQRMHFAARTTREIQFLLRVAGRDPGLAEREPFATLAGDLWRAVGNDVIQFRGDPSQSRRIEWALTRVDFYRLRWGGPEYELSALYVIYPNVDEDGRQTPADPDDPTLRPIPPATSQAARTLITDGRPDAYPGFQRHD
jgi:hypothetical protein